MLITADSIGLTLRDTLEARGYLTLEDVERLEADVHAEVEDAIAFAESSPEPPLDSLYENVYS